MNTVLRSVGFSRALLFLSLSEIISKNSVKKKKKALDKPKIVCYNIILHYNCL